MPKRQSPSAGWLYPLLGSLAVFAFVAIAVYVLTSMWRERATAAEEEPVAETATATILTLTPIDILDRRLAAGEITIEQALRLTCLERAPAASRLAANESLPDGRWNATTRGRSPCAHDGGPTELPLATLERSRARPRMPRQVLS
jgi:hypothetical protein